MTLNRMLCFGIISTTMIVNGFAASTMDMEYQQGESYAKGQSGGSQHTLKNPAYDDIPGYGDPYQNPPPVSEMTDEAKQNISNGNDPMGGYIQGSINATAQTEAQAMNSSATKAIITQSNADVVSADKHAVFCEQGSCADKSYQKSNKTDMDKYASMFAAANEDGMSYNGHSMTRQNGRSVNGRDYKCRDMITGYSNCCKDSGWGQDLHLAGCESEEKTLGHLKQENECIYVGRYCADKLLGSCTEHKKTYCCFNSVLDKIIRDQGGRGQLHIGYGTAHHPLCKGLTIKQLQTIDYSKLNYSDYYSTFEAGLSDTTSQEITDRAKSDIAGLRHETPRETKG